MADKSPVKDRGRGRGLLRDAEPDPEPPHPDTINMIRSGQGVTDVPRPAPEQFSNATPIPVPPSSEVIGNSLTNNTINNDTSRGPGKCPPLVAEMKESMRQGMKVLDPQSAEFVPLNFDKVNINVEQYPLSNGLSDVLMDCSRQPDSSLATKHLPTASSLNSSSKLNQFSEPFNPRGLNVAAPEFVPTISVDVSAQIGSNQLEVDQVATEVEDEFPTFDALYIIREFTPVVRDDNLEVNTIIKTAAEVLYKGVVYAGSFEQHLTKLKNIMVTSPQEEDDLKNLAEMIVYWGVTDPSFLFTTCKMCKVFCDVFYPFRKILSLRLGFWYDKLTKAKTVEEKYYLVNFGLFLADVYSQIKPGGNDFLMRKIFELVNILLALKTDEAVIGACNILKLTGSQLELSSLPAVSKMDEVVELMKTLSLDLSLSRSCTDVLIRVIQRRARNWAEPLVSCPALDLPLPREDKGLKLNVDAKPFVPSDVFQFQKPVSAIEEWNDFETDYYDTSAHEVVYDYPAAEFDEDELDLDIELEMEAFIGEIEQHLLMQDFDPDIVTDTGSSQ